jgi:hypothetical protein
MARPRATVAVAWPSPSLPAIVAASGLGILLVALADAASRAGTDAALPLFWLGMLALFGPATVRLVAARGRRWVEAASVREGPRRVERLAITVLLALALYLVKVMVSPLAFSGPDEFSHWRTLEDVLRTGHLFAENPLLQVSSVYPGLEAAAATASVSSGLGAFPVGILLIAASRLLAALVLFLIAERVTSSSRVAGVASLIYMANPSFLSFDAAFSYESLALPFALTAIWATLRWTEQRNGSRLYPVVALGSTAATAVTHHLTSLALLTFFVTWAIVSYVRARESRDHEVVTLAAAFAFACSAIWIALAGTLAISYVWSIVGHGLGQLLSILVGNGEARHLFNAPAGYASPLPEVVVAYAAAGLLVLSLPVVLLHAAWRRRPAPIVIVLGLVAALYPPSLALRFTVSGAEVSQRASEFVFVGLAILAADWLVGSWPTRWRPPRWLVASAILLVVAGGIVTGDPPIGRLPGPYHVAAEQRSFEPQGRATAAWVVDALGPENRLIADRTNAKLLGSLGLQYPVSSANSHLGTAYVMYARALSPTDLATLRAGHIRYVVVDLRLTRDLPIYPYVFEQSEPNAGDHKFPIAPAAAQKWDTLQGVRRIYDSGDIVIYDVGGLVNGGS